MFDSSARRLGSVAVVLCSFFAAGCVASDTTTCADGVICPRGQQCDDPHGGCIFPEQLSACDQKPEDERCEVFGAAGNCDQGVCLVAVCGDGKLAVTEACDDGNTIEGDGCSADCQSNEMCGNG